MGAQQRAQAAPQACRPQRETAVSDTEWYVRRRGKLALGPGYNGPSTRGCGGIGRRARFRSVWGKPRGGSSPLIRIHGLSRRLPFRPFLLFRVPSVNGGFEAAGAHNARNKATAPNFCSGVGSLPGLTIGPPSSFSQFFASHVAQRSGGDLLRSPKISTL